MEMEVGFRKMVSDKLDKKVYFVKRKTWEFTASVRVNEKCGSVYIISTRENYKNWHTNEIMQAVILHEFGHLLGYIGIHFFNEMFATFAGWWRFRELAPLVTWKSPFKLVQRAFLYFLNKNYRYA
jgi:hypothetical protein